MKTLDEVIDELEDEGLFTDALEWLKGYKAHIELDRLRDKCEAENEPLTWDELRQMEGKPVWMEYEDGKGGWVIVGKFFSLFEHEELDAYVYMYYLHNKIECSKELYGSYWQAYRKERAE